jgi:hypothetical protein
VTVTQNPKTDTEEIRGKLEQESGQEDKDDAQEGPYGRANRSGVAAGGSGSASGRRLPMLWQDCSGKRLGKLTSKLPKR